MLGKQLLFCFVVVVAVVAAVAAVAVCFLAAVVAAVVVDVVAVAAAVVPKNCWSDNGKMIVVPDGFVNSCCC